MVWDREATPARFVSIVLALCLVIFGFYWRVLNTPFAADDYIHIADAANSTGHSVLAAFGPIPDPPGIAFRPFGFLIYWLTYLAAGTNPYWWHLASLVLHAVNATLLFALCLQLRIGLNGSAAAAMLFALNGSSVEALSWIDGRFDPLSAGFVLAGLFCTCRYLNAGRGVWLVLASLAGAAAMFTKESAFCLPLLTASLWFFQSKYWDRSRFVRACASSTVLTVVLFVYRWWAIGGLGGYRTTTGELNIGRFHVLQTLNAVFLRDWAILFYPVNWSRPPGWLLMAFLTTSPLVLAVCAWLAKVPARVYVGCFAFTVLAALPVQHLLLIGTDLANTRLMYLLSLGWALLWGAIFSSLPGARSRVLMISWLLVWQGLMLRHNLSFWLRVTPEARAVCTSFGRTVAADSERAVVAGLPRTKDGVVFLANGFPECVAAYSSVLPGSVTTVGEPNYRWNPATESLEKANGR